MSTKSMGSYAKFGAVVALVASNSYFVASASRANSERRNLEVTFAAARGRMVDLERSLDQLYAYSEVLGQMTRGNPLSLKNHEQVGLVSFTGQTVMLPKQTTPEYQQGQEATLTGGALDAPVDQPVTLPAFFTAQATFEKLLLLKDRTDVVTAKVRGLLTLVKVKREYFNGVPTIQPAEGRISSQFGMRLSPFDGRRIFHAGIDVAAEVGSTIWASADGVVTFAGNFDDLGRTVVIGHGFGIQSRYGHTEKFLVKAGQKVRRGQPIAIVGMTGNTTGPHLHYEIWVNDVAVDPMEFMIDAGPRDHFGPSFANESLLKGSPASNFQTIGQGG